MRQVNLAENTHMFLRDVFWKEDTTWFHQWKFDCGHWLINNSAGPPEVNDTSINNGSFSIIGSACIKFKKICHIFSAWFIRHHTLQTFSCYHVSVSAFWIENLMHGTNLAQLKRLLKFPLTIAFPVTYSKRNITVEINMA